MGLVTIPILPSPQLDETTGFYGLLGFAEQRRFPGEYLTMARPDGLELHFWFKKDLVAAQNDVACYVRFETAAEARALYEAWSKLGLGKGSLREPVETDYGLLEFALLDPHRNLVRVGGRLPAG